MEYVDDEFAASAGFFGDTNCTYPLFTARLLGGYSLGDTFYAEDGQAATEMDTVTRAARIEPVDQNFVSYMNESAMCGLTDWQVGEVQEIADCGLLGDVFDIVRVEEDAYYIGDATVSLDASSESRRPRTIDYTAAYRRLPDREPRAARAL